MGFGLKYFTNYLVRSPPNLAGGKCSATCTEGCTAWKVRSVLVNYVFGGTSIL